MYDKSSDGTKVHEEGEVLPGAKPEEGLEKVQGGFEFNSPDGQHFVYSYTADENGYVPQGDGIPEIPAAIVKSLEWNAAHPEKLHEEGEVLPGVKPEESLEKVQGGFEFNSPEGQHFVYSYTADENGYVPQGDGISEIPAAIVKSLEWNAAHPEKR
ncbi:endocuticle structural glycoprotein SgAbd-3-like [Aethina tumida]|uniref:endocuticle structural glycoprotein SgAbd-3-like n=1 Tax=Aethina tumida TaxID=116153 RepID=UPI002148E5D0|nr:endocuticle structural glycoprotein SgAbd-3-like [Aethina tumida]